MKMDIMECTKPIELLKQIATETTGGVITAAAEEISCYEKITAAATGVDVRHYIV